MNIRKIVSLVVFTAVSLASTADAIVYRVAQLEGPDGKRVTLCYESHVPNAELAMRQRKALVGFIQEIEQADPSSTLLKYEEPEWLGRFINISESNVVSGHSNFLTKLCFSTLSKINSVIDDHSGLIDGALTSAISEGLASSGQLLIDLSLFRLKTPSPINIETSFNRSAMFSAFSSLIYTICCAGAINGCDNAETIAFVRQALSGLTTTQKEFVQPMKELLVRLQKTGDDILAKLPNDNSEAKQHILQQQADLRRQISLIEKVEQQSDQGPLYKELFERAMQAAKESVSNLDPFPSLEYGFISFIIYFSLIGSLDRADIPCLPDTTVIFYKYCKKALGEQLFGLFPEMFDQFFNPNNSCSWANPIDLDCIATGLGDSRKNIIFVVGGAHADNIRSFLEKCSFEALFDSGYTFQNGEVKKINAISFHTTGITTQQLKPIDFTELKPQLLRK